MTHLKINSLIPIRDRAPDLILFSLSSESFLLRILLLFLSLAEMPVASFGDFLHPS